MIDRKPEFYGRQNGRLHSLDNHIRRPSARSSASLNDLPDLTFSAAMFTKLKSNIDRHTQSKLRRDPLPGLDSIPEIRLAKGVPSLVLGRFLEDLVDGGDTGPG